MGTFSIWHWVIVLVVVLVLFGGRGKIPSLMGDVAKGIKSFKSNMKDEKSGANKAAEIEADNETDEILVKDDQSAAKD
jgi:sec-independent protein translocase protein TatA